MRPFIALLAAAAVAAIVITRVDGGPARAERPAAVPARLVAALAALSAADPRLRAVVRERNDRFMRHSRALLVALRDPGLGGAAGAAARLRADVVRVQARVRAAKPSGKRAKQARRLVLKSQAAAITGLEEIRRFVLDGAVTNLDRAATSLGSAQRLAKRASRQLACRRPCGNGF